MKDERFPLCKALGLGPAEYSAPLSISNPDYFIPASAVERVIAASPVVYGVPNAFFSHVQGTLPQNGMPDTHCARLIAISPIVRDTPEGLLRDLYERGGILGDEFNERARKLVGDK